MQVILVKFLKQHIEELRAKATSEPVKVLLIGLCIPILGRTIDLFSAECVDALARSGSVLVAYTLCIVFINHMLGESIGELRAKIGKFDASIPARKVELRENMREKIRENLGSGAVTNNAAQIEEIISKGIKSSDDMYSQVMQDERDQLIISVENRQYLGIVELVCGVLGTLVWGFGDLTCGK